MNRIKADLSVKAGDIVVVGTGGRVYPATATDVTPVGIWTSLGLVIGSPITIDEWSRQSIELRNLIVRLEKHYERWK